MKVSVEWLREYVDLPDCADELVDVLPMLGIEVEVDDGLTQGAHGEVSATRGGHVSRDAPRIR